MHERNLNRFGFSYCFEGQGFKSESVRIDVQIRVRHEKEIILHRGAQTPKSWQGNSLPLLQHCLHLSKELFEIQRRSLFGYAI